ncbi:TetR/AcrR family transcriptional regulator [Streptomyces rubrolavendulae]|uniref:Bacterial regulatory protein, tetR family n=1 Tax=Streptomyces rubrolavendulae TaxID=285473 RepID=A0A1D8FZP7_9ACTN|nr:TetR/AcrR family transcriptional regulator [Streptomyces rubrolavendulae]AOT58616.1 Bacterial regulatory protein, tetR family [Streptomyces rubrolavendulae]
MPTPKAASSRTPDATRRSERSRRAIYDAALALVVEVGYARTTVEGIASRAGVGKQTIYRWWPSKSAVLLDAYLDLTGQAGQEAQAGREGGEEPTEPTEPIGPAGPTAPAGLPDTGDLAADLKAVLRATVDELNDPRFEAPTRALTAEGVIDPELGARFVERLLEPQLQLYVRRLAAARDAGLLRPGADLRVAVELLVGPLTHRWLMRTRPLTHAYADELVDHVLQGIAPR